MKRCYYEILNVHKEATDQELKISYRKLAMEFHPDRNPDNKEAEDKFKEAAEAYDVLRDPEKRNVYDQYGHDGLQGQGFSGFRGFEDIFSSFGDIFEDFFGFGTGRRGGRGQVRKGADLRYDMTLEFTEAAFGVETQIDIVKREQCSACSGSGCESGTVPENCEYCGGAGQVSRSQGFFTVRTACPQCRGEGRTIPHPCQECRGRGLARVEKKVTVKVPAGVDNGSRLRLTGEGEGAPQDGIPGDLYIFLRVKSHEFFHRDDLDVVCQIPISFVQAALGDEVSVPTLSGELLLKIKKGTQSGDVFTFRGEGIPSLRGNGRGNQLIQVLVKTPTGLNAKQEALLREFAAAEEKKFSTKIKKIFNKNA